MELSLENKTYVKKLTTLALPMVLQELLNASVNLLGTLMVGTLGLHAVTAVGLSNVFYFLNVITCFGVISGASVFMGQFWGKGDIRSIRKTLGISMVATLFIASIFASLAIFAPRHIMVFYSKNDEQVIQLGITYLRAVGASYLLTAIVIAINTSLKCIGKTKFPAISTLIALTCSLSLSALFIFKFNMGVAGAAYATLISRFIEIIVQITLIRKFKIPILGPLKDYFSWDLSFVKSFYVLTLPIFFNELTWAIGNSLYSFLYKTTGTEGQGAAQISGTMQTLFLTFGIAVGNACSIMISNALGAGNRDLAISYSKKSMVSGALISFVMSCMLILAAPHIISFYNVSDIVKQQAFLVIVVISIGMVLKTLTFITLIGILRAGGDTKYVFFVDSGCMWFVGLPCVFVASHVFGLPIYFLVAFTYADDLMKLILSYLRIKGNKWAKNVVEHI